VLQKDEGKDQRKGRGSLLPISRASPDISPGHPRFACRYTPAKAFETLAAQDTLASGLGGFRLALDGHLGHARLTNRTIYWLRRSSPTWLGQNGPEIRVLMNYPG